MATEKELAELVEDYQAKDAAYRQASAASPSPEAETEMRRAAAGVNAAWDKLEAAICEPH